MKKDNDSDYEKQHEYRTVIELLKGPTNGFGEMPTSIKNLLIYTILDNKSPKEVLKLINEMLKMSFIKRDDVLAKCLLRTYIHAWNDCIYAMRVGYAPGYRKMVLTYRESEFPCVMYPWNGNHEDLPKVLIGLYALMPRTSEPDKNVMADPMPLTRKEFFHELMWYYAWPHHRAKKPSISHILLKFFCKTSEDLDMARRDFQIVEDILRQSCTSAEDLARDLIVLKPMLNENDCSKKLFRLLVKCRYHSLGPDEVVQELEAAHAVPVSG